MKGGGSESSSRQPAETETGFVANLVFKNQKTMLSIILQASDRNTSYDFPWCTADGYSDALFSRQTF